MFVTRGQAYGAGEQVSEGGERGAPDGTGEGRGVLHSSPGGRSWQMRSWEMEVYFKGLKDFECIVTCLSMESMDGVVLISPPGIIGGDAHGGGHMSVGWLGFFFIWWG